MYGGSPSAALVSLRPATAAIACARSIERNGSERAAPRVLQIDDVGPKLHDNARPRRRRRHWRASASSRHFPICAAAKSPVARAFADAERGQKSDATVKSGGLIGRQRNPIIALKRKRKCIVALRAILAIAILVPFAPQAAAQSRAKTDPDWPCQQIKTPTFSLASVWAGPQLDLNSQSWRNESDVADLEAQMAQRRVPIADVEKSIADFKAKAGPDADAKLLRAFAAAFEDLSQQRSQIIDGLDRFGRKQNALADRIRAENEAVQKSRTRRTTARRRPAGQSRQLALGHPRLQRSPSDRRLMSARCRR